MPNVLELRTIICKIIIRETKTKMKWLKKNLTIVFIKLSLHNIIILCKMVPFDSRCIQKKGELSYLLT